MADNVIWDDDPAPAPSGVIWDDEPAPEHRVTYQKHFVPSGDEGRGTTEMLATTDGDPAQRKLVGPVESGNTTGRAPEPVRPMGKPAGMEGLNANEDGLKGYIKALANKFGNGAAFGGLPKLTGVAATAHPNDPGAYLVRADGEEVPYRTDAEQYEAGKQYGKDLQSNADNNLGKAALIPEIAGGVASSAVANPLFDKVGKALMPIVAKGAEAMGPIRQAINVAGANALAPAALQAANTTDFDGASAIPEFAAKTVAGTAAPALLSGAFKTGEAALDKVGFSDWVKQKAAEKAGKAKESRDDWFFRMLNTRKGAHKKLEYTGKDEELPDYAFREGLVGPTTTPAKLLEAASEKKAIAGQGIDDVLTSADEHATPDDIPTLADTLASLRTLRDDYAKRPGMARALPKIDAEINAIEDSINARAGTNLPADPRVGFRENEKIKRDYDVNADWDADKPGQQALKDTRTLHKQNTEKRLEDLNPYFADKLDLEKTDYGNAAGIEALAKDAVAAEKANNKIGLGSKIAAAGGAAGVGSMFGPSGSLAGLGLAALVGGGHHVAQKIGPSVMASNANRAYEKFLNRSLNGLPYEQVSKALSGPVGRAVTDQDVNDFMEWLRSQTPK